jgi:hypothetical protein
MMGFPGGCRFEGPPFVIGQEDSSMKKFIMLLHDAGFPADISPDQIQAIIQRYVKWRQTIQQNGRKVEGHKLTDGQGRVMRGGAGSTKVTDGPYAEAREVIGGLFIVEANSYEEVVELSKDCPHLDFGSIEIREVDPT